MSLLWGLTSQVVPGPELTNPSTSSQVDRGLREGNIVSPITHLHLSPPLLSLTAETRSAADAKGTRAGGCFVWGKPNAHGFLMAKRLRRQKVWLFNVGFSRTE